MGVHLVRHIGIVFASLVVIASPLVLAAMVHPTPVDWRTMRFESDLTRVDALAGRASEIRERDAAWNRGRTEMEFLAQHEQLRTQATDLGPGYRQGRSVGQQMGRDAIASAQQRANATGQPVDVIIR